MSKRVIPSWLQWTCIAVVSWGVWAVLSKLPGDAITAGQSQALSTLGMLPMLPLLRRARLRGVSMKGVLFALTGGIVSCLGNLAFYESLLLGEKVAAVVPLTALYPLVTILLAMLVLRERMNLVQTAGMVLSFVAIWLFNIPDDRGWLSPTVVHVVLPIVLWGLSGFLQKFATNHLPADTASLLYLGAFVPIGIFLALQDPWPATIPVRIWVPVLGIGFFLAFGNFAMLVAFAGGGKAAIIAPLGSLYPVISVPIAVLVLGEKVGPREIAGIVIALISVAALSFERTPGKPPAN